MSGAPILVVDDNDFIRSSMLKFLETNGYEAIGVSNAKAAMGKLRIHAYSLIITDVLMPDTDGFELVDFIREQDEPIRSTPIIAISGGGRTVDASTVLNVLEEKVDLILKKPFSKNQLINNVGELIRA